MIVIGAQPANCLKGWWLVGRTDKVICRGRFASDNVIFLGCSNFHLVNLHGHVDGEEHIDGVGLSKGNNDFIFKVLF